MLSVYVQKKPAHWPPVFMRASAFGQPMARLHRETQKKTTNKKSSQDKSSSDCLGLKIPFQRLTKLMFIYRHQGREKARRALLKKRTRE